MALREWELQQQLATMLPLSEDELAQVISYAKTLSPSEASKHLSDLLGNSKPALDFVTAFNDNRTPWSTDDAAEKISSIETSDPLSSRENERDPGLYHHQDAAQISANSLSRYFPPSMSPPFSRSQPLHANPVTEAGRVRAQDEVRSVHHEQQIANNHKAGNAAKASKSSSPIWHL